MIGGGEDCYPSIKQRRNGYLRALKPSGIANTYFADFNIGFKKGSEKTSELLRSNPQITALFAVNDEIAVNAMHAAQELGLRVPHDHSVVGYDDTYLAVDTSLKLSTVRVDTIAMGRATVHPSLVERDSVAGPAR
jgi:LacI family transcriptional regulator